MEFIFTKKARIIFAVFMLIGIIAMAMGYMNDHSDHHNRFWANIFVNGFFFFAISLGALFFLALQYATLHQARPPMCGKSVRPSQLPFLQHALAETRH